MARIVYGNGSENIFMNSATSGTTPVNTGAMDARMADIVSAQLVTNGLSGAWKIEISNDEVVQTTSVGAVAYGQPGNAGTWTDITASFSPALVAVVSGTSGENQRAEGPSGYRAIRYTFTPTSGAGAAKVIGTMKASS